MELIRRLAFIALVSSCLVSLASPDADASVTAAARAFAAGQAALLDGKPDLAAKSFELADSIIPTKQALRSAARARMLAGQLAYAATHAEALLERYPEDSAGAELANDILADARPKLARFKTSCSTPCSITIAGRALIVLEREKHDFYLEPGRYGIDATFESGETASRIIAGAAGEEVALEFKPAPAPAPPPSSLASTPPPPAVRSEVAPVSETRAATEVESSGVPQTVVWIGVGATVVVGSIGLWSALDTRSAHGDYLVDPTAERWDDGRSKQLRTNVLWGATGAVGLATMILAIFADWGGTAPSVALAPAGDGAMVEASGRF